MPNPYPYLPPEWVVVQTPFGDLEVLVSGPRTVHIGPFEEEVDESAQCSSSITQQEQRRDKAPFVINGRDYNTMFEQVNFTMFRTRNGAIGVEFNRFDKLTPAAKRQLISWAGDAFDDIVTPLETAKARYRLAVGRASNLWEQAEAAKANLVDSNTLLKAAEREYLQAGAALDILEHEANPDVP